MKKLFWLFVFPLVLHAQEVMKSPEEIQAELEAAESQFKQAQEMFSPWYTGPLITPGASMMPPANGNTQPYLFVTDNYAAFDRERKSVKLPNSLIQVKGSANIQTGLTDNLDVNVTIASEGNWQSNHHGGGFGDMSVVGGFLIYKQTRYVPAMKFTISEIFPTGKYKNLNSNGLNLDGVGAGAYSTQFGLGFAKVVLWTTQHPMNLRCFFGYQLSTVVNVKGFNVYGGGTGCSGRVHPGNIFSTDFGYEISLSQSWVAAIDVVYSMTKSTKFHGNPGTRSDGSAASVGTGYSDNLSLAPALEYNWNPNLGLIAGAWFSVYGRNSLNFLSGIISLTYSFP